MTYLFAVKTRFVVVCATDGEIPCGAARLASSLHSAGASAWPRLAQVTPGPNSGLGRAIFSPTNALSFLRVDGCVGRAEVSPAPEAWRANSG